MTQYPDLFAALAAPFDPKEVRVRSQAGRDIQYITARTAMNRLDTVLGPENWWDDYLPGENSVLCRLTIRLPDGSTVTKSDAGGHAGMADQGDDEKSGFSDAFKRAAVKFGVSRYLYRDGVPYYGTEQAPQQTHHEPQQRPNDWRERAGVQPPQPPQEQRQEGSNGQRQSDGPPRTGRALFAWIKEQETKHDIGLLKYINGWAKLQELPSRVVDWDAEQTALGLREAERKLAAVGVQREPGSDDESY